MQVVFEWLEFGLIPVLDLDLNQTGRHYWHYLETNPKECWWNIGQSNNPRVVVPIDETRLQPFLEVLRQPLLENYHTLVVYVRSVFNDDIGVTPVFEYPDLGADPVLFIGALATVERLPEMGFNVELVDGCLPKSCLELLEQFLRIAEVRDRPEHPLLQDAWLTLHGARLRSAEEGRRLEGWRVAQERALALLKQHLNEDQLAELEDFKGFHVVGADGRTFRIHFGSHGNVFSLEKGVPTVNYCIIPSDHEIPTFDLMLAQKVMLENAPKAFFDQANATPVPEDVGPQIADPKVSAHVLNRAHAEFRFRIPER